MKKLFLSSLGINIIALCLNMATGIISARYLGPFGRGELAAANRWSGLFIILFTVGLPGAVIYLGKQHPAQQRSYFGSYILIGGGIGLMGMVCGELLIPRILAGQPKVLVHVTQIAMLSVPFGVLSDGLVGTLQTINHFKKVMITRILSDGGAMLAVVGLLIFGMYTARAYIFANTMWSVIVFGITLYWVVTLIRPRLSISKTQIRDLLAKGSQIYATSLINVFGGSLDQLAISLFLAPYTLGLYAVSSSVGAIFPSMIVGALSIYLWPKLMDLHVNDRNQRVGQIHGLLFYGSLVASLAILGLTHFLIPILYGEKYIEGIPMAEIIVLCTSMTVGYVVLVNYISTRGKFYYTTLAEALGLTVGLGFTVPLIHVYGGIGAAIGLFTANLVKWIFLLIVCVRLGLDRGTLFKPDIPLAQHLIRDLFRKRGPSTTSVEIGQL